MSRYFSPKDVAKAIGVSESSLKRWVDKGFIRAAKTAGGHRRLELDAVLDYVRSTGRSLTAPEAIELPEGCGVVATMTHADAVGIFKGALISGDEATACRVILDLYLNGASVAEICDSVIAPVFHDVGNLWECGDMEVYEERRACELCLRVVHELRRAVGAGPVNGPVAMGGTLDGDPYTLATSLAELVLRNNGWKATSLGNMLPFDTIRSAILKHRPKLFWISVTSIRDIDRFTTDFNMLFDVAESVSCALVAGGQALTSNIRQKIRYTHFSDTFRHLESFAHRIASFPVNSET
ncbi:MAG: B12-binding domain-containing protein [Planctomycetaceae bacterium]